ncbi:hypothetical protein MSAR_05480 [Mycolicibacterium sarraceniae]|uniref:Uncharacterized protein n=1 Tax=Mycolicibacterium sarraceniae TaxID=1534348 RepID=A0A7I7SKF0_9MYCO|nr:hypothetical protein MSAR_05480 [Mycolicibacterium sarraceniae]
MRNRASTCVRQVPTQPAGPAAGVEDVSVPGCHRVHETRLTGQVVTGARHRTETLDVPMGMTGIGRGLLHPDTRLDHATIIRTLAHTEDGASCSK